mmetsp:Transcript_39268/g.116820  ORF Transcript_39268/g.116820 Transcript_39268/m.116820 type:complete len:212 (+) Transcript_39268:1030-1665(+)
MHDRAASAPGGAGAREAGARAGPTHRVDRRVGHVNARRLAGPQRAGLFPRADHGQQCAVVGGGGGARRLQRPRGKLSGADARASGGVGADATAEGISVMDGRAACCRVDQQRDRLLCLGVRQHDGPGAGHQPRHHQGGRRGRDAQSGDRGHGCRGGSYQAQQGLCHRQPDARRPHADTGAGRAGRGHPAVGGQAHAVRRVWQLWLERRGGR